ncbi:MAG TPA: hypothetical protein VLU46_03945 [Thermoanaerobaculia bacterium]|nr:hypothetical protein [Thermoanaerobaculia bacterium]
MSVARPRRLVLLLLVLTIAIGLRCSSYHLPAIAEPPDFCTTPTGPRWRPVVCVDETALTANPKVQIAYDVEPGEDKRTPSNRPVAIFWRTHRQFNLQLQFVDKSCVDQIRCNGNGHCSAVVRPLEAVQGQKQTRRCTYRMLDGGNPQKTDDEADIVITACCM